MCYLCPYNILLPMSPNGSEGNGLRWRLPCCVNRTLPPSGEHREKPRQVLRGRTGEEDLARLDAGIGIGDVDACALECLDGSRMWAGLVHVVPFVVVLIEVGNSICELDVCGGSPLQRCAKRRQRLELVDRGLQARHPI